ncbi:hypothetical protein RJT34_24282 [Clitoria ternatea]|uniref:Uncharacterized protein n=1 Tax=Clitoria ternatea TaxID=43366 RepID=A0AAN9IL80_CLITE
MGKRRKEKNKTGNDVKDSDHKGYKKRERNKGKQKKDEGQKKKKKKDNKDTNNASGHTAETPTELRRVDLAVQKEQVKMEDVGVGAGAIGVAVVGAVIIGLLWKALSTGSEGKTMKAPGRDYRMSRDDFEHNPAKYFRDLHKHK